MHSSWRAGRPRLPGPTWKRWGVHEQPLRDAYLALKLTRVEQRRGHYTNALRRASLGLRALGDATGPEAGAARGGCRPATRSAGSARVATRMPVDGRSEPSGRRRLIRGRAGRGAPGAVRRWRFGRRTQGRAARETALHIFEQLGDLGGQAHALNNLGLTAL